MVYRGFRSLSPAGLLIEDVAIAPDRILVTARCRAAAGQCPDCGRPSEQVHSRYERRLLDLPSHGRAVQMRVTVRRFRCAEPGCRRRIFAEPLGDAVAGRSARRTSRLESIVHHLGIALGGRPAAALAAAPDAAGQQGYLAAGRAPACCSQDRPPLHVIGIDDWAWKRGQRYGSIICDLERRRIVDLLPDREPATVEAWLSHHPEITRHLARPRRRIRPGCDQSGAPSRASRRSLAPDGERQRRLSGSGASIDAPHPHGARQHRHRPGVC